MQFAGPIEFSTGELVIILVAIAASFLAIPMLAGVVAYVLYRRKTPIEERERWGGLKMFALWTALAFLVQILVLTIWWWITGSG